MRYLPNWMLSLIRVYQYTPYEALSRTEQSVFQALNKKNLKKYQIISSQSREKSWEKKEFWTVHGDILMLCHWNTLQSEN